MTELYVLSNTLLIILAFCYFCQIRTEQKSKHKIHDLFLNYKPERNIRDQEFINKRFLLYVYPRLKPFNNDYFSKRGFKNLEFCFAETLVNILNEYNNYSLEKNEYMMLKLKTKFNKFIDKYGSCFYILDKEIFLKSLGQRLIRNMCSCEIDLFNFYHIIYKIINRNSLNNMYFMDGLESYLHNNEIYFVKHHDVKIDKNEIFNLYKHCFKNISDN
jgi:hypothetical protein